MSGVVKEEEKAQESSFRALDWSLQLPALTLFFCLCFSLLTKQKVKLCLILQVLGEPPPLVRRVWRGSGC